MDDYTPTSRGRLRRVHQRGHYDRQTVYEVLDAGFICHVAYVVDGQPLATPTAYWRDGDRLYWHGSSASRMIKTVAAGVPTCLTVTHLDGLVLARSGFHTSLNYRSVMAFGTARAIVEAVAKRAALEHFMERLVPGRWPGLRPPSAQELKATTVVFMDIEEAVAKIRSGPPVDDAADMDLAVWAGVVPVTTTVGAPEPDPELRPGIGTPENLGKIRIG